MLLLMVMVLGTQAAQEELQNACQVFSAVKSYEVTYTKAPLVQKSDRLTEGRPILSISGRFHAEKGAKLKVDGTLTYRRQDGVHTRVAHKNRSGRWVPLDWAKWWAEQTTRTIGASEGKLDKRVVAGGNAYSFDYPHELLANLEGCLSNVERREENSTVVFSGKLTSKGAEHFAGRFFKSAQSADMMIKGGGLVLFTGSYSISVGENGAIEQVVVDTKIHGKLLGRTIKQEFRQRFRIKGLNKTTVTIPTGVMRVLRKK